MPRKADRVEISDEDRKGLEVLVKSRAAEARLVERAGMVLMCLDGKKIIDIARECGTRPNTVIYWRNRFKNGGVTALGDLPRSGKPRVYGEDFRNKVLKTLEQKPPIGQAVWDGASIAAALEASPDAVWRVLRNEGICLQRQRSWCVSTDPEFTVKAADVIGLYLNPPEMAIVISVDEKPSIQALQRSTGYVETSSGKIVRGLKSTYKRNGTLNLFAALHVATGAVTTKTTEKKCRVDFIDFMDNVIKGMPGDREIHVILDNYCIHKRNDLWLMKHPNVHFHFTPTSASWLNMVEIWFGIMSRKALRGATFSSKEELRQAIEDFVAVYNDRAKPFIWRKREVKGAQLRNTIANLCN
jgi:transposase